ncbi:chorismate mutase [Ramicandelaber brevisporus]|nr:chorismate mutase [Ramicandelaber brevisporus]
MDFLEAREGAIPLSTLRNTLIRLEDTIIFAIIERAQFKHNNTIYQPGKFTFADGFTGSFLAWFLKEVERVHARVRRYQSPDEFPFTNTADLPEPVIPPLDYPKLLFEESKNGINVNSQILDMYLKELVPQVCKEGDDLNYGSAATRDVECLQALSRRIHYGKFVAEAKFVDPKYHDKYVELIKNNDRDGIMELLTDREVERKLLVRLRRKALIYGQDIDNPQNEEAALAEAAKNGASKIDIDVIVRLYEQFVIPLTKEVEVEYLLQRLNH